MRHDLALLALLVAAPFAPAQPPARPDDEPLPAGAVARLGSAAAKPSRGWGSAVLSPDGTKLFAAHSYRPATWLSRVHYTLYDSATLRPLGEPVATGAETSGGHSFGASLSRDGSRFAGLGVAAAYVHDTASGKQLLEVSYRRRDSATVSVSADGKLVAVSNAPSDKPGDEGVACVVWDVDAQREVARVSAAQEDRAGVVLSPDGKTLVTYARSLPRNEPKFPNEFFQVWDLTTGEVLARVPQLKSPYAPAFSPDSKRFAFHEYGSEATKVVETRTGKGLVSFPWDPDVRYGPIAFSPDGRTLAVFGPKVGRWDVATGKLLGVAARPAALPTRVESVGLAYSGPDRLVAVGRREHAAYAWDALSGRLLSTPPAGLDMPTLAVAFAAGGKEVVTAGEHDACRWDAATGAALGRVRIGGDDPGGRVALSPDGSRGFAAGFMSGEVRDLAADKPVGPRSLLSGLTRVEGAQFLTAGGSMLAALTYKGNAVGCRVLEVASGKVMADVTLIEGADSVAARLSADGARLVVACNGAYGQDGFAVTVGTYDAKTGAKLGERTLPKGGGLRGFALLDATHAVLGSNLVGVRVLDLTAGQERDLPDPQREACEALEVSPDGKLVAVLQTTRDRKRHVRLYELATGKVRATLGEGVIVYKADLRSGAAIPSLLAFSPDGTRLVTPESETTALVWDVPAAK